MLSKSLTVLMGVLLGVLVGCAGENQFSSTPPNVRFDGPKFQCLRDFDDTIMKFIEGGQSDKEVVAFWNCLDTAVVQFVQFVQGGNSKQYSPVELARFIDDFFIGGTGLKDETKLLEELMLIKTVLVGGSTTMISHSELFVEARKYIREFKEVTLQLNPHMGILHGALVSDDEKDRQNVTEAQMKDAIHALNVAGSRIANLIHVSRRSYSFSHLGALIEALEGYLKKDNPKFELGNILTYLPLLGELKGLLVAQPSDRIEVDDWSDLFKTMTQVLGWTAQYRTFVEDREWERGPGLAILESILNETSVVLQAAVAHQPKQEFAFLDLNRVLERLDDLDLLPLDLDDRTMRDVLLRLGTRSLSKGGSSTGLDVADIAILKSELERWMQAQNYINEVLIGPISVEHGGGAEMALLMRTPFPLLVDEAGRIQFSKDTINSKWDRSSLTTLNWQRAIIRVLMRGYAPQTSPDGAVGLTKDQMVGLANDWQVLAEKLGLFEAGKAEEKAKKIFMEANLFVPNSNGDDKVDFSEAVQYLSFGVSGLHGGTIIRDELTSQCTAPGPLANNLAAACVRRALFTQRESLLSPFPLFVADFGVDQSRFGEFFGNIESTTRDGINENPFTRGDIVESLVLMQFIETFFMKFDAGNDQRISVDETLQAFPTFKNALDEIVKGSFGLDFSNDDLVALFTYLFKYGKPPQKSIGGVFKFLNWRWSSDRWSYDEDRVRVAKILAELNAAR